MDFIIIGAQKCGTTSYFRYLQKHPSIYMPSAKEIPIFNNKNLNKKLLDHYLNDYFSVSNRYKKGKASPQYMTNTSVADEIFKFYPKIKLIVLLKNPIERAYSHYKMCVRRNFEKRDFQEAIRDQLDNSHKYRELEPKRENEINFYLTWGEYGRLLDRYFEIFDQDQILILYTKNKISLTKENLFEIYDHLEIERIIPDNINTSYHKGGLTKKINFDIIEFSKSINKITFAKNIYRLKNILPKNIRHSIAFKYKAWNLKENSENSYILDKSTMSRLNAHFIKDINKFNNKFSVNINLNKLDLNG